MHSFKRRARLVGFIDNRGWWRVKSPAKDFLPSRALRPLVNGSTTNGFVAQIEAVLRRMPFTTWDLWGRVEFNAFARRKSAKKGDRASPRRWNGR